MESLKKRGFNITFNLSQSTGGAIPIKNIKTVMASESGRSNGFNSAVKNLALDGSNLDKHKELLRKYIWEEGGLNKFTIGSPYYVDVFNSIEKMAASGTKVVCASGNLGVYQDSSSLNLYNLARGVKVSSSLPKFNPEEKTYTDNALVTHRESPELETSLHLNSEGLKVDFFNDGILDYELADSRISKMFNSSKYQKLKGLKLADAQTTKELEGILAQITTALKKADPEEDFSIIVKNYGLEQEIKRLKSVFDKYIFSNKEAKVSKLLDSIPIGRIPKNHFLHKAYFYANSLNKDKKFLFFGKLKDNTNDLVMAQDGTLIFHTVQNGTSFSAPRTAARIKDLQQPNTKSTKN
ncbi:MAG: hypothetical protein QNJ31_06970 [Candidatus Caenarcaniphilales bacterium]|nr:hypothetical protein [Candidatus Caenarcaniphilales bacterium]